jgi:hypothetical protein
VGTFQEARVDEFDRKRIAHLLDNLTIFEGKIEQREFDFLNGLMARYRKFGSHLAVSDAQLKWLIAIYYKVERIPLPPKEGLPAKAPRDILATHVGGLLRYADYAIQDLELHGFIITRKDEQPT